MTQSTPARRNYSVTCKESTGLAVIVEADSAKDAIHKAQRQYSDARRSGFSILHTVATCWEARPTLESKPGDDIFGVLHLALRALNSARRFKVGDTDSYAIASQIGDVLRRINNDPL